MKTAIAEAALKQIFTEARTFHHWLPKDVSNELLQKIYEAAKWGPTSVNANPMRILYIRSAGEKEKLLPALLGSNVGQVKEAPVTAVIAYDEQFYDQLPTLFPAFDAKPMFAGNQSFAHSTAIVNSSLQGAYFMIAARSLGLDVGPMAGFDNAKVDETFFKGTSWKSNFLCNVGFGDETKLYPRGPRLNYEMAVKTI
jgi:3-hydroxypropanoate dehydrogenase